MRRSYFLCYSLFLTLAWMQFYAVVRESYNGLNEAEQKILRLEQHTESLKVANHLVADQFLEFRQYVSTLMPDVLKQKGTGEAGYPYRNLASLVSNHENAEVKSVIAKTLFETGKDHFRRKEFQKAIVVLKKFIERYSHMPYVTEAFFLIAEGHFQNNEFEESTAVINQMIELFPKHELTGFAILRLGRIYEAQNRNEEAVDLYRMVIRTFPQRDVAAQAKSSLRGLDL